MSERRFQSFEEFWPFYLSEHRSAASRRLHFLGTSGWLGALALSAARHPVGFPLAMAGFAGVLLRGARREKDARPLGHVAAMFAIPAAVAPITFPAGVAFAYTCAWIGHFGLEKNRPATFDYPLFSGLLTDPWVTNAPEAVGRDHQAAAFQG